MKKKRRIRQLTEDLRGANILIRNLRDVCKRVAKDRDEWEAAARRNRFIDNPELTYLKRQLKAMEEALANQKAGDPNWERKAEVALRKAQH